MPFLALSPSKACGTCVGVVRDNEDTVKALTFARTLAQGGSAPFAQIAVPSLGQIRIPLVFNGDVEHDIFEIQNLKHVVRSAITVAAHLLLSNGPLSAEPPHLPWAWGVEEGAAGQIEALCAMRVGLESIPATGAVLRLLEGESIPQNSIWGGVGDGPFPSPLLGFGSHRGQARALANFWILCRDVFPIEEIQSITCIVQFWRTVLRAERIGSRRRLALAEEVAKELAAAGKTESVTAHNDVAALHLERWVLVRST